MNFTLKKNEFQGFSSICRQISYSYIIITALSGAFVASVGLLGVMKGYDMEDLIMLIMWYGGRELLSVLLGTIVIGVIGFFVQLHRLKIINAGKPDDVISE